MLQRAFILAVAAVMILGGALWLRSNTRPRNAPGVQSAAPAKQAPAPDTAAPKPAPAGPAWPWRWNSPAPASAAWIPS